MCEETIDKQQIEKYYNNAKDFHALEVSVLSQRTNFYLIVQSLFIGGMSLAFNQQFPYVSAGIITLLIFAGISFSILHIKSGEQASSNMRRWRLYMKSLEAENPKGPWESFYYDYENDKHKGIVKTSV